MRKSIVSLIQSSTEKQSINERFTMDVKSAIIKYDILHSREGSNNYKPSSMNCMRNMYFTRIKCPRDESVVDYQMIGMADTGTRRHEAIQTILLNMESMGYDWKYIDVESYVLDKQKEAKCKDLVILEKFGAETHLLDTNLHVSFRVDGIVQRLSTGEYYLFEFKNQTSFKYRDKIRVDDAHMNQVVCYCTLLDLDKALVLYENRDICELTCPQLLEVTDQMKQDMCINKLIECEEYVRKLIPPPKCEDEKYCKWCDYKHTCAKL